jgi:hypothetical protein
MAELASLRESIMKEAEAIAAELDKEL